MYVRTLVLLHFCLRTRRTFHRRWTFLVVSNFNIGGRDTSVRYTVHRILHYYVSSTVICVGFLGLEIRCDIIES